MGGNCGQRNNCCEPLETREASCLRQQVAALQAEKYADSVGIETYKAALALSNKNDETIRANQKEAFQELVTTRERLATADANFQCLTAQVQRNTVAINKLETEACESRVRETQLGANLAALAADTKSAIQLEAERRACADNEIRCWVKATYVPGSLKLSPDAMCPPPVTCCGVVDYFNKGGTAPVPSPCCSCGSCGSSTASGS